MALTVPRDTHLMWTDVCSLYAGFGHAGEMCLSFLLWGARSSAEKETKIFSLEDR